MCLALDPGLEGHEQDPGMGDTLVLCWRLLPSASLKRLPELWAEVSPFLEEITPTTWSHLSHCLWSWVYPQSIGPKVCVTPEDRAVLLGLARQALLDLAPSTVGRPGLAALIRAFARKAGFELPQSSDPLFEMLFPERKVAETRETADRDAELSAVADEWATRAPLEIGSEIARYEREGRLLPPGHESLLPQLCREIASRADSPVEWLNDLVELEDAQSLIAPLLERAVADRASGVEPLLVRCLESPRLWWLGVEWALRMDGATDALVERAVREAQRMLDFVETLCSRGSVPLANLHKLLASDAAVVRVAAAVGEWHRSPTHEIRPEVRQAWKRAVIGVDAEGLSRLTASLVFWFGEIVRADPLLAFDWLLRLLPEAADRYLSLDGPAGNALDILDREQRIALLPHLRGGDGTMLLVSRLVGGDDEVYEQLLRAAHLRPHHLDVLRAPPDDAWARLAMRALVHDYAPREVAAMAFAGPFTIVGDGIDHWQEIQRAFSRLRGNHSALRAVAEAGLAMAAEHIEDARRQERSRRLQGI